MTIKKLTYWSLLLCLAWPVRVILTGSLSRGFILWNIFLAFLPLIIFWLIQRSMHQSSGMKQMLTVGFLSLWWLLFLPNAFYIVTDFMHLNSSVLVNERGDAANYISSYRRGDWLFMYDAVVLFFSTLIGALAGVMAIKQYFNFLRKKLSENAALAVLGGVLLLSAIGVYIGRFGRWNSWDVLLSPWSILIDTFNIATDPDQNARFFGIVATILIYHLIFCGMLWNLVIVSKYKKPKSTK